MSVSSPLLIAALSLFSAPPAAELQLAAPAGQSTTLSVTFSTRDVLLNREAPNRFVLTTPWGKVEAKPTGIPHQSKEFAGYFARVRPVTLGVKVPAGTKFGSYWGQLNASLFVCDVRESVCTLRPIKTNVKIQVGQMVKSTSLALADTDLRPARLKR